MKKSSNFAKGFTLIELLVVVAIIGVLASVILVALSSSRSKAKDARIISDVQQLRLQIESDASGSNYGNSFYPLASGAVSGTFLSFTYPSNVNSSTTWNLLTNDALSNTSAANAVATATMAVGGTSYGTGPSANAVIYVYTNGVLSATAGTWTTVPTAYAIWGKLSTGNLFCIDSTGNTRNPSATITAGTLSGAGNNGQYQACQ